MYNQPKLAYKLKYINDDFIVDEVSLLPKMSSKENATYTYLKVEKSSFTTFEAQEMLRKYFDLDYSEIVFEGLKDEDAKTSQVFSINKILEESDIDKFNKKTRLKDDRYIRISGVIGFGDCHVRERGFVL